MAARRSCALALTAALLGAPVAAEAGAGTLRRSLQNIAFAPLDAALAPAVAVHSVAVQMRAEQDPTAVRVAFAGPGVVWNGAIGFLAAGVRELTGLLELLPGLALLPFEAELTPLFSPAERGPAWVDWDTRALHVRFGVDYTTLPPPETAPDTSPF